MNATGVSKTHGQQSIRVDRDLGTSANAFQDRLGMQGSRDGVGGLASEVH